MFLINQDPYAGDSSSNSNRTSSSSSSVIHSQAASVASIEEENASSIQASQGAAEVNQTYMQHMTVILVILHVSVFITGLIGNALVCLSVYRNKSLQTVTNYYIVNLAVADFLVILICLPPTVYWDLNLTWNFGLVLCKLVLYLQVSSSADDTCSLVSRRLELPQLCLTQLDLGAPIV